MSAAPVSGFAGRGALSIALPGPAELDDEVPFEEVVEERESRGNSSAMNTSSSPDNVSIDGQ